MQRTSYGNAVPDFSFTDETSVALMEPWQSKDEAPVNGVVGAANFREDVTVDGTINSTDISPVETGVPQSGVSELTVQSTGGFAELILWSRKWQRLPPNLRQ